MPYPVMSLIEGRPFPVTVSQGEPVAKALDLLVENEFSQLPVITEDNRPLGMVTYEGILHGVRNFYASLDDLHVRDVMTRAKSFNPEDDLFDLLEELKRTNAVLIVDVEDRLVGIVTSYDSTEFFRGRAENLMHVEDIEGTIKEFVWQAYLREDETLDEERLAQDIVKVTPETRDGGNRQQVTYDQLSLGQYVNMLISRNNWPLFEPFMRIPRDSVRKFLEDIRDTRNQLAHFRSDISVKQAKQLRWCAGWLARCKEEFDLIRIEKAIARLFQEDLQGASTSVTVGETRAEYATEPDVGSTQDRQEESHPEITDIIAEETKPSDSRYAPLADWLRSQPGKIDMVTLSFDEIETVVGGDLPTSARDYRAWWANDSPSRPQSRVWLEAGWRTTYINMTEGRVTFARIREREKLYIDFFGSLLADLRAKATFPIRDVSPDGSSWVVCQTISSPGFVVGQFDYSFTRGQRFRVELYVDTHDQATTKAVFDRIHAQKSAIEEDIGSLEWERIDNKRASRVALYHMGSITDDEAKLAALRAWAVDAMIAFYETVAPLASQAFEEVLQS